MIGQWAWMDFTATRNPLLLLEAALAEGMALGLTIKQIKGVPHLFGPEPDAWVQLAIGDTTVELPVLVRRDVTPDTLGAFHAQFCWGLLGSRNGETGCFTFALGACAPPPAAGEGF